MSEPDTDEPDTDEPDNPDKPMLFFHVGAPKTGTTFLQRALWDNREALQHGGVLYPGDSLGAQVHAAFDLRGAGFQGYQDPRTPGAWAALVDEARDWEGPTIISQELFSPATTAQIDTALEDLSFAEVHLVYTVRELSRQIPAAWQEDLKNRFTPTLDEFVLALRDPDEDPDGLGEMFWRMQDAPTVLARWSRDLPPEHVHVITVPRVADPPDLLWRRFAGVVGIDPDAYDVSKAFGNTSLGAAEAEFLRRLNLALTDEVSWPLYDEVVKHHMAQDVLSQRPRGAPVTLQPDDAVWVAERASAVVDELATAGYQIVGSLDDLLPPDPDVTEQAAPELDLDAALDLGVEVAANLILRLSRQRGNLKAVETLVRALAVTNTADPAPARQRRHGAAG